MSREQVLSYNLDSRTPELYETLNGGLGPGSRSKVDRPED